MTLQTSKYLNSIAIYSISVVLALLLALGIEQVITWNTTLTEAGSRLVFATTFPALLIVLLIVLQRLFKRPMDPAELLNQHCRLSFAPETIQHLNTFKYQLQKHLDPAYAVRDFGLYVFDWQQNMFICAECPNQSVIPQGHPLVRFAEVQQVPFCTERSVEHARGLSDMQLAELMMFMRRNGFVCMIPLFTEQGMYGFVCLTLEQIKDSKLFAMKSLDSLKQFSQNFGRLLQKILIYDAIVLKKK